MKRKIKKVLVCIFAIAALIGIYALCINGYVVISAKNCIISIEQAESLKDIDCIVVLGAGVRNEKPTPMLQDRLDCGIALYNKNTAGKIIVSGDHGSENYDEVNAMKNYSVQNGVLSQDVFMDHAGFSSYETIYRAKEIFKAKNVIVVSQRYHLYRCLYIAKKLGINAYGVSADSRKYAGQVYRDAREIIARNKDFLKCAVKPKPTFMGDTIPVSGNGNDTNDK